MVACLIPEFNQSLPLFIDLYIPCVVPDRNKFAEVINNSLIFCTVPVINIQLLPLSEDFQSPLSDEIINSLRLFLPHHDNQNQLFPENLEFQ